MFREIPPIKKCVNKEESFGEICVKCNACGRFDKSHSCETCKYSIWDSEVYFGGGQILFISGCKKNSESYGCEYYEEIYNQDE